MTNEINVARLPLRQREKPLEPSESPQRQLPVQRAPLLPGCGVERVDGLVDLFYARVTNAEAVVAEIQADANTDRQFGGLL